ncbi:restriction endonuclease subunit S [Staphylococcus lugdunensis]|uniref:restriction endonuclease subunit S n=1 Tax=Staphylococcus lugdunensis TaxID=28035 RepID=UPI001F4CB048|nr:restriction endonuclease subunit S [Staphylococcus lugdunensis]MCH8646894.1 restriction endonuclease subunit S [Staphylococcus lugdunensis]
MTNEQKNVPQLRFPNYKDLWSSYQLNNISERVTRKNKNLESKRPLTISGQLGLIDQIEYFNKSVSSKNLTNYTLIKKGEFAYNKSYSNGYPLGAIKMLERYDLGILSSLYICFSFNKNIDKNFMKNYFESTKWFREVASIAVEGARNHGLLNIPINDFFNINLKLPIEREQEKIGDFFSKLDRQIELEEQKLELLKQQKKGYMKKIFSQELRFKDENENDYPKWTIRKIEDISKVNKGFTPNTKNDKYWDDNKENWLSIAGMNQKYLYKGNKGITEKGSLKHNKVDSGTLIMSFKLTLGKLAIVKKPIYTNEAICHFVWKDNNINTEYMYYYLNSINISKFGAQAIKGITLNNDSINSIIVKLPIVEEQVKIADFLLNFEKLTEKQIKKVELLKQRKKGLLQKMFV